MHPIKIKIYAMNLKFVAALKSHNFIILLTLSTGEHPPKKTTGNNHDSHYDHMAVMPAN